MKITNLFPYVHRAESNQRPKISGHQANHNGSLDTDTVSLSAESVEYLHIRDKARSVSSVRSELVERIKQEIASGRYHIDAYRLAEAMLREGLFE